VSSQGEPAGCGHGVAAPAVRLGNTADLTSPGPQPLPLSTVKAWYLRSFARELMFRAGLDRRMRNCGVRIAPRERGVEVFRRPDRAYGRIAGVCVCGQSIACPVCAPRIAAFRSGEVAKCFSQAKAAGYEARLCTFTLPHSHALDLGIEVEAFRHAWSIYQSGKKAVKRAQDSLGNHVAREITFGKKHGFHFHFHQLRYDLPGTFCETLSRAQWLSSLDAVGRLKAGADRHAFDCGIVGDEAGARYVAKLSSAVEAQARAIGSEIASAATKGRNFSSLLLDALRGDGAAEKAWLDGVRYVTAKKISSVRWSRGLRDKVGLGVEKTDDQVAQDEVLKTDQFLGALLPWQWRAIIAHRAEFPLCVAAQAGVDQVNEFLTGISAGQIHTDGLPDPICPPKGQ